MDLGLGGRTAIVCGASSGIGLGIAETLAAEGANVVMFARRRDLLEQEAARLGAIPVTGDVTSTEDLERLVETAIEAHGGVEEIVKLRLTADEKKMLRASAAAVREVVGVLKKR